MGSCKCLTFVNSKLLDVRCDNIITAIEVVMIEVKLLFMCFIGIHVLKCVYQIRLEKGLDSLKGNKTLLQTYQYIAKYCRSSRYLLILTHIVILTFKMNFDL